MVDSSRRCLNLSFSDISRTVKTGVLRNEKCEILHGISGDFRCGELTAIMGPSGAGKSMLMDILAGFTQQTGGTVSVNDSVRDLAAFRRSSAYIMQDDYLEPLLTVDESMHVAADLKLRSDDRSKRQRIEQIIVAMGLASCRSTRVSDLSGGQRKRLAIGLELVNNPPIMFFDEPTSGLDSVTSKQCISLLKALAHEGPRTIIVTIHQPSATLFHMVDHLYVIVDGSCIYTGGTRALIPYLAGYDLHCPTYYNPADFLLEICNGDYGDYNGKLIDGIENGKSCAWRVVSDEKIHYNVEDSFTFGIGQDDTDADVMTNGYYSTGFLKQLFVLFRRNFIKLSRDKILTFIRLGMHCAIALCVGFIFYDVGQEANQARNNIGVLFFSLMFLMFSGFSATIITFPSVLPIITREHFNRWYKLRSFYLASKLADLPIQIAAVSLYLFIVYFLTGQILEIRRFILLSSTCLFVSLVAQIIGVIVGIAMSMQNAIIFGCLVIMPFVIFSGFFVHMSDAPWFLHWLFHVSFLKYGFQGAMASIYGFERSSMPCTEIYCHYKHPKKLLMDYDMQDAEYQFPMLILVGLYLVLHLTAYVILRMKLKKRL